MLDEMWFTLSEFMSEGMWWWLSSVILIIVVACVFAYIWVWAQKNLPLVAEKDKLFTTIKKGKIKVVKKAGKIVGYYSNLFDQGKYAKRDTGEIVVGSDKDLEHDFWWKNFGVIWIGFGGSVYTYPFEKMDIVDGDITKIKTTASSIFLKNRFVVTVEDAETKEMVPIKLVAQLITETKNAGLSLNYDNWINVVESQVKSACRDFIALKGLREITLEQLESADSKLFTYIMSLNTDSGNKSLEKQIGQEIIEFSLISLEISDQSVKNAVQSGEVADEANIGKIKNAEGDATVMEKLADAKLKASLKEAEGIKAIGNARNEILEKTAELITKKGAGELEKTRALAYAIEKSNMKALSFGGGASFIIGDDNGGKNMEKSNKEGK